MGTTQRILVSTWVFLGLACRNEPEDRPTEPVQAEEDLTPSERTEKSSEDVRDRRDEWVRDLQRELDELDAKLDKFEDKTEQEGKQARAELREARDEARKKLERLKDQGNEAWEKSKDELRDALAKLRAELEEAEQALD